LGADRLARRPALDEYDFYNARYLDEHGEPVLIRIEVLLVDVTPTIERTCFNYLERWDAEKQEVLGTGDLADVDAEDHVWCLRLLTLGRYSEEDDEFEVHTHYATAYDVENERASEVPRSVRRDIGFIYLRTLRTGSRALSLERGSLLDVIIRTQSLQTGIWEGVRSRLAELDPPIEEGVAQLRPVLENVEDRLGQYIPVSEGDATRLFVSQLTREHLRTTLSFFLRMSEDQQPVPFQKAGTGTLNTLVLALLSFVADLREEGVIFAMEEPEIALPPHTQRRIASYLLSKTTQCFVTSHSPYVIECFDPATLRIIRRDSSGAVNATGVELGEAMKAKTYRRNLRRSLAEAMLGTGVIVAEGATELAALHATAEKMEEANPDLHSLDLAGVTIVSADGDGNAAELGRFFASLDVPSFAFLDKKKRPKHERDDLGKAGFEVLTETDYEGTELLLTTEVPIDHQWDFMEGLRDSGVSAGKTVPGTRPDDDDIVRGHARNVLRAGKGEGWAGELVSLCSVDELPETLTKFLDTVYARFPRPRQPVLRPSVSLEAGEDAGADGEEVATTEAGE
jgi:putative ATP-dependent endonuclease of OLD family